jgi:hypothetical protein
VALNVPKVQIVEKIKSRLHGVAHSGKVKRRVVVVEVFSYSRHPSWYKTTQHKTQTHLHEWQLLTIFRCSRPPRVSSSVRLSYCYSILLVLRILIESNSADPPLLPIFSPLADPLDIIHGNI